MKNYFDSGEEFNHLSLRDLLDARDQYHIHLMHKDNVVATAVGKYRSRKDDPYPNQRVQEKKSKTPIQKPVRTLSNSEVRYYSWPCILVFVEHWKTNEELRKQNIYDMIPEVLYLPDGRKIPVCVVEADKADRSEPSNTESKFPDNLIGGGYPIISEVQGKRHLASIGCLVTDGHKTYALTNHHVAGKEHIISSILSGKSTEIGKSADLHLSRCKFEEVYPLFKGHDTYIHMDIGLVEVYDLNYWTSQVYGLGTLGKIIDLSSENISLNLVGCPVKAFGCASGPLKGQIDALFYRYKSIGGFEYISDFLIGKRSEDAEADSGEKLFTNPGDSGTLWVYDDEEEQDDDKKNRPVAIQWGGHVFNNEHSKSAYALATCLSTVCNLLDIDVVRDWNIGQDEYWGAVGHYTIANIAIELLKDEKLKKLMRSNLDRITFETNEIEKRKLAGMSNWDFVPMADVPDMVWKIPGGAHKRGKENPNHFADMDKKDSKGNTLLDLMKSELHVGTKAWLQYYNDPKIKDSTKGCLPFRVWQIFDEMVGFVEAGKSAEFIAASGILSHYVGDACQPLHISYMFNGIPNGKVKDGDGVHSAYEENMINKYIDNLRPVIDAAAKHQQVYHTISDGKAAAYKTILLMKYTFKTIDPKKIVEAYIKVMDESGPAISKHLYDKFHEPTIDIMAHGSALLASLWESAWASRGNKLKTLSNNKAASQAKLRKLYQNKNFLPSLLLKDFDTDPKYQ